MEVQIDGEMPSLCWTWQASLAGRFFWVKRLCAVFSLCPSLSRSCVGVRWPGLWTCLKWSHRQDHQLAAAAAAVVVVMAVVVVVAVAVVVVVVVAAAAAAVVVVAAAAAAAAAVVVVTAAHSYCVL